MNDSDASAIAELRRFERQITDRETRIAKLSPKTERASRLVLPRRYVTDITIPFPIDNAVGVNVADDYYEPAHGTLIVDRDCREFIVHAITFTYFLIIGITDVTSGAKISVPSINAFVATEFTIEDTFTNRRWSNTPIPAIAYGGGRIGELRFSKGARLPPGTTIDIGVSPKWVSSDPQISGDVDFSVSEIGMQIALIGEQRE